ncbi:MAG: thioredoxin family protein [Acidobacteria bacterium]|nr:thioredoxin family protein [Acidobacteriota bacterium]
MKSIGQRTFLILAAAALVASSACNRSEPVAQGPVDTVSNHRTVAVKWEKDLPAALERAKDEGKPVLVNFYADWCVWCKRLESTTLSDARVASFLQDQVVPLSLDVEGDGRALSDQYRVDGLPTVIVLDGSGLEIGRIPGYMPPDSFLEAVEGFLQES